MPRSSALIPVHEAYALLEDPTTRFVDGSWHMPASGRSAADEYRKMHIAGAVFFDIDDIADPDSDLPHMMPDPARFARKVGALGLSHSDRLIIYDVHGLMTAARVWWSLKIMGAEEVLVLDGGLPAWRAAGYELSAAPVTTKPATFNAKQQTEAIATMAEVQVALAEGRATVLDARSEGRFMGRDPEPRAGLPSGHMPGARNLPFLSLLDGGRLKSVAEIRQCFGQAGWTEDRPIITSCGSGITACVLAFAAYEAYGTLPRVFDGSWTQWASCGGEIISTAQ